MWKRKYEEEIMLEAETEKKLWRKNYLKKFSITFLIMFCILPMRGIVHYYLYKGYTFADGFDPGPGTLKLRYLFEYFIEGLWINILVAMIATFMWLRLFRKEKLTTVICNQCHKTKNPDGEKNCLCGGIFESIELFTWIDDQKIK